MGCLECTWRYCTTVRDRKCTLFSMPGASVSPFRISPQPSSHAINRFDVVLVACINNVRHFLCRIMYSTATFVHEIKCNGLGSKNRGLLDSN